MKYAALSGAVLIPLLTLMTSAGGGAPSGEGEAGDAARPAPFLTAEDPRTFRLHRSRMDCIVFPLTTYRAQHLTVRLRTVVGGKPVVVGERTYGWNVGDFTDGKAIVGGLLILAEGGAAAGGEGPPVISFDVDYPFGTGDKPSSVGKGSETVRLSEGTRARTVDGDPVDALPGHEYVVYVADVGRGEGGPIVGTGVKHDRAGLDAVVERSKKQPARTFVAVTIEWAPRDE